MTTYFSEKPNGGVPLQIGALTKRYLAAWRQLSPDELVKAGVPEDAVRPSVDIEHIDDLPADLAQALAGV